MRIVLNNGYEYKEAVINRLVFYHDEGHVEVVVGKDVAFTLQIEDIFAIYND